jgi:hypothetical protein
MYICAFTILQKPFNEGGLLWKVSKLNPYFIINTIFIKLKFFGHFETFTYLRTRIKWNRYWRVLSYANTLKRVFIPRTPLITHICDGLGRAIQTLDHIEREIL